MKTLKCLFLCFFVVSQLAAQTNGGTDSTAPDTHTIVFTRVTTELPTDSIGLRPGSRTFVNDSIAHHSNSLSPRSNSIAPASHIISLRSDSLTLRADTIALRSDALALRYDTLGPGSDTIALHADIMALRSDILALRSDIMALRSDIKALHPDTIAARSNNHRLQSDSLTLVSDTVALAKSSAYQKEFERADRLLTTYNANHNDMEALSFHGLVLYWMKAFDRSIEVYEKAIHLFPQPSFLHLDYARLLFNLNKLRKAGILLKAYGNYDSSNVEAAIMSAYIDLYIGKTGSAKKKAELLLKKYPGNAEAKDIISKVSYYTIPYIKTGIEMLSDDQPLKGHSFHAEAGVYRSRLFAPTAQAAFYRFNVEDSSFQSRWMQLANTIQLGTNNKVKLKGGLFQQNGKASDITGSVEVSSKFAQHFSVQAALERRPYQYATASIKTLVMENLSGLSLGYNRNDKWFGKAAYELVKYKDANKVHTAYLWVLAPVVSVPHFSLSGGYAFRYADAVNNNFVSKAPISDLIASPPYDGVSGIYSPYFTPENQMVHAALAALKFTPSKKIEFSSRINIGLFGKADNPYLWLQETGNQYRIRKAYAEVDFKQATWVNELRLTASDKFSLSANYSYDKLLFYASHKGSIAIKYLFSK